MPTDLALHVRDLVAVDTHEHLKPEAEWVNDGPKDIFQELFGHYPGHDLVSGGASHDALVRFLDGDNPDLESRWAGVERAWHAIRHTGYGEAVRIAAADFYGIEELSAAAARAAQRRLMELRRPGMRLSILRDRAKLDHIQTDACCWPVRPDPAGPSFFLFDINCLSLCAATFDPAALTEETGITVHDLATLRAAIEAIFIRHAALAIAVKSQHAYLRTLRWADRSDTDAARALTIFLADPKAADEQTRLCLGDWCMARIAEHAAANNLPFKIHCGYYAGYGYMDTDRIAAGHLCALLAKYKTTRFVLMHTAYPYGDELIAVCKHFPNAYADLCWAWAVSPLATGRFVRHFLHAAPANKLFVFGGDTSWPTMAYAYSVQMRRWLARALREEVDEGVMSEAEAIDTATRLMRGNQLACFDVEGRRRAIDAAVQKQRLSPAAASA